jgi:hypothetical protein
MSNLKIKKYLPIWDISITRIIMSWKERSGHGSFLVACSLALTGSWKNYYMDVPCFDRFMAELLHGGG